MAIDPSRSPAGAQSRAPTPLAPGTAVALLVSRYHGEITGAMAASARALLAEAGVGPERVLEIEAPGAFELPVLAQAAARRRDVHAVLCFGLVLKGETDHDVHIAGAVAHGLTQVALDSGKPVLFGVLTCASLDQARARARTAKEGGLDKGREVALAAVEALLALEATERAPLTNSPTPLRPGGDR